MASGTEQGAAAGDESAPPDRDLGVSRREFLSVLGATAFSGVSLWSSDGPGIRQYLLSKTDPLARRFGAYTAYQLHPEEFVGRMPHDRPSFELWEQGYEPNPLSAAKYHPATRAIDDSSWRRVDEENHRWQWHVHVWAADDEVELFSHYEYRPDPRLLDGESRGDMHQRLRDHLYPNWDINHDSDEANYFLGKACPRIEELLDG